jgi:hypothetical protein
MARQPFALVFVASFEQGKRILVCADSAQRHCHDFDRSNIARIRRQALLASCNCLSVAVCLDKMKRIHRQNPK